MGSSIEEEQAEMIEGSHAFLSEELFSPLIPLIDLTRLNMFDSHLTQKVVLNEPEFPRVFTGFENQGGKYSDAYKRFPNIEGFVLTAKIEKNAFNELYIFVNKKKKLVYVYEFNSSVKLTERYGYKNLNRIKTLQVGKEIKPERLLHRSTSFDKYMNYRYGINMKVAYFPWRGQTYEDSIVIADDVAEKFASTHVEEVKISLNTNDILMNIYGDDNHYKCIPNIGEEVVNRCLAARRRLSYESLLYDFSKENMNRINFETDDLFTAEGKVVDIDIFCNANIDDLADKEYNRQLSMILNANLNYYNKVKTILQKYKDDGYEFIENSNYYLQRAINITSGKKFRDESNDFDNMIVVIKTESVNPLSIGAKISNRCGGKGVISVRVKKREEMPELEDGTRADACLNIFGVMGRVNLSQLVEQETNFIADQYLKHTLLKEKNLKKRSKMYIDFIKEINKGQSEIIKNVLSSLDEDGLEEFWKSTEENGIFINLKPFYNDGYNAFKLYSLYKKFNIKPRTAFCTIHGKRRKLHTPMIIGDVYYMRLKHDAKCKFSARSGGYLSLSNVPSKNNRNFKENRSLYSKTAVRLGDMELNNLMLLKNMAETVRFISAYSSNQSDREKLAMTLLGVTESLNGNNNIFDIEKVEKSGEKNLNKAMLDALLYALSMKLEE